MARGQSHTKWIRQQFRQNLKCSFRNVILHASFIESVVRNESGEGTFDAANRSLLADNTIIQPEFEAFDKVRELRNKLVHKILKKSLTQKEIEDCRDDLMKKIREAYGISALLDRRLIKNYGITAKFW